MPDIEPQLDMFPFCLLKPKVAVLQQSNNASPTKYTKRPSKVRIWSYYPCCQACSWTGQAWLALKYHLVFPVLVRSCSWEFGGRRFAHVLSEGTWFTCYLCYCGREALSSKHLVNEEKWGKKPKTWDLGEKLQWCYFSWVGFGEQS